MPLSTFKGKKVLVVNVASKCGFTPQYAKLEELYEKYPKVLDVCDMEKSSELDERECAALIRIMELRNKLTDMEMQSVYFRGCYDSVGYLKKAGIL